MFGLLLSVLSLAVAIWAWMAADARPVFFALLVATICLAIVAPFDAPDPPRRTRVLIACLAYVAALATAILLSHDVASGSLTIALFLLVELGVGLTCWALATRNRHRVSGLRRYYDN